MKQDCIPKINSDTENHDIRKTFIQQGGHKINNQFFNILRYNMFYLGKYLTLVKNTHYDFFNKSK